MPSRTRLTKKLIEEICSYVRLGTTYDRAARVCGTSGRRVSEWKARGHADDSGIFYEFAEALCIADIEAEILHLQNLEELAKGGRKYTEIKVKKTPDGRETTLTRKKLLPDATISKWILERRFPERWAKFDESKIIPYLATRLGISEDELRSGLIELADDRKNHRSRDEESTTGEND